MCDAARAENEERENKELSKLLVRTCCKSVFVLLVASASRIAINAGGFHHVAVRSCVDPTIGPTIRQVGAEFR